VTRPERGEGGSIANSILRHLVSVIIPVYNRSGLLREAVESVLRQEYPLVEVVIVDDGSTDETPAVIDALAERYPDRVRAVHKDNSGPGPSREAGRLVAQGEFIQYLDSDDLLSPEKFADQVSALQKDPDASLCYCITEYYRLGEEAKKKVFAETDRPVERVFPAFLVRRRWGTSSPLYRRSVVDRIGPWGEMWSEEDWEYDCRIGALGAKVLHINRVGSWQRGLVGRRLSQQGRDDPRTLLSQAEARMRIYRHAKHWGATPTAPEMEVFLRGLFMLARDCGGVGLVDTSRRLSEIVLGETKNPTLQRKVVLYRRLAELTGWRTVSRVARILEHRRAPLHA